MSRRGSAPRHQTRHSTHQKRGWYRSQVFVAFDFKADNDQVGLDTKQTIDTQAPLILSGVYKSRTAFYMLLLTIAQTKRYYYKIYSPYIWSAIRCTIPSYHTITNRNSKRRQLDAFNLLCKELVIVYIGRKSMRSQRIQPLYFLPSCGTHCMRGMKHSKCFMHI